jgi:hypothetical protein
MQTSPSKPSSGPLEDRFSFIGVRGRLLGIQEGAACLGSSRFDHAIRPPINQVRIGLAQETFVPKLLYQNGDFESYKGRNSPSEPR